MLQPAPIEFDPQHPQLTKDGRLHHFLTLEGLSKQHLEGIFELAESYIDPETGKIRKVPALHGVTVINMFFEPSTRTRTTFELAEQKLTADFINLNIEDSSTRKGETLLDTVNNLEAMQADMFVIRHRSSGAINYFARHVGAHMHVMNAGDGSHQHPTQAMLDMFTILQHKPSIEGLTVAIVGDIKYSRVARSQIQALHTLKAKEIRIIGPRTLMPAVPEAMGVTPYYDMDEGLKGVDVVIMLRLQVERMRFGLIPSPYEYFRNYGLNERRLKLAKPDAIVMHPGPLNRNVEIDSKVADSPQSVILQQVTLGIATRMALMATIMGEAE